MKRFLSTLEWAGWAAFGLLLPVTSFPLLLRLAGSSMVAPLAGPLVLGLLAASVLPRLLRREPLPRVALPLAGFAGALVLSSALIHFETVPGFRDLSVWKTEIKAFVTLAFGLAFYLTTLVWAKEEGRLRFLLGWVNAGGAVMLGWCAVQALVWRQMGVYPPWMEALNAWIAPHELYRGRVSGMAFEPSWLAHQLNMLYLPWWGGAALCGQSAHRWRLGFITVERALLLGGLAAMVLSLSRVGLIAVLLCLMAAAATGAWKLGKTLHRWLLSRSQAQGGRRRWLGALIALLILLVYAGGAAGLLFGAARGFMRFDPRMARLFDFSLLRSGSVAAYANQLVFAERVVYWQAGWQVFNDHPLFGVGLGNAGFYLRHHLSPYAWGLHEVRSLLLRSDTLLNPKSIWLRVLGEGGLLAMGFYLAWLFATALSAALLFRRRGLARAVAWMGVFALIAMLSEGMSIDSFALPYTWVSLAMVGGLAAGRTINHPRTGG